MGPTCCRRRGILPRTGVFPSPMTARRTRDTATTRGHTRYTVRRHTVAQNGGRTCDAPPSVVLPIRLRMTKRFLRPDIAVRRRTNTHTGPHVTTALSLSRAGAGRGAVVGRSGARVPGYHNTSYRTVPPPFTPNHTRT